MSTGVAYDRSRRREAAREGWRRRRRAGYVARGRARARKRDRHTALALAYPVQQIPRARFAELYEALRAREGRSGSDAGLETHWARYVALTRLYRAKGQGARTTNAQGVRALELAGRPRCRRTVQRVDAGLAAMGLVRRHHVRLGRARPGFRDHLRVEFLSPRLRQQEQQGSALLAAPATDALRTRCGARKRRTAVDSAGCAGRERGPPAMPAANGGDEGNTAGAVEPATADGGAKWPPDDQLTLDELADDESSSFSSSLARKWLAEGRGERSTYHDLDERRARLRAGEILQEYREHHDEGSAP